jgi:hypothetical protein
VRKYIDFRENYWQHNGNYEVEKRNPKKIIEK